MTLPSSWSPGGASQPAVWVCAKNGGLSPIALHGTPGISIVSGRRRRRHCAAAPKIRAGGLPQVVVPLRDCPLSPPSFRRKRGLSPRWRWPLHAAEWVATVRRHLRRFRAPPRGMRGCRAFRHTTPLRGAPYVPVSASGGLPIPGRREHESLTGLLLPQGLVLGGERGIHPREGCGNVPPQRP